MCQEEVEQFLLEIISVKKQYSLSDLIFCCMAVNQKTLGEIIKIQLYC